MATAAAPATGSKGRGRGRGLLRTVVVKPAGQSEPSPGADGDASDTARSSLSQTPGQFADDLKDIEEQIESLAIDINEEDLTKIQKLTERLAKDEQKLKDVAEIIYNKSLCDREFAKCAACICDRLSNIDGAGGQFRAALLKLVQSDFKDKDQIRKNSLGKFLSLFSFICQMFCNMKDSKGEPFKVLIGPIYMCIDTMMDTDQPNDDEYECLSLQLQSIGKELESVDASKMNSLMEKVRQQIIKDGRTARGRCTLLEVLECYARGWKTMPNDITRFYCDTMADVLAGMIV